MSFPVEGAGARLGLSKFAHLEKWLAKIHALPAYQRALEKGGPYELMG